MDNYIKVLWVDDDLDLASSLPDEAIMEGINMVHFPSWEEAEPALEKEFDSWDAIVLDAHCRVKRNEALSSNAASRFLMGAVNKLPRIFAQHGRQIPWYILSAGIVNQQDLGLDGLLEGNVERLPEWDYEFDGTYYTKGVAGANKLFQSILHLREMSIETRIAGELYPEVFRAIDEIGQPRLREYMMGVLKPMHDERTIAADYNHRFNDVRRVIESVFANMIEKGLLPSSLRSKGEGRGPNLSWCSLVLIGDTDKYKGDLARMELTEANCPLQGRIPKIMGDNIKNMIFTAGNNEHADVVKREATYKRSADLSDYFRGRTETDYLVRSFALQLCDFVLWYSMVLKSIH